MQPRDSNSPQSPLVPVQPFSLKAAFFMMLLVLILIPVAFFLPLLMAESLGSGFVAETGLMDENFGSFMVITQSIGLIITVFLIRTRLRRLKLPWSAIGLKKFRILQAILYIGGFYLLMLFLLVVAAVFATGLGMEAPEADTNLASATYAVDLIDSLGGFWSAFILAVILAPVIEEILFRGILFPALRTRYGIMAGVIISGVLFALVHVDPVRIIGLIPMGIYLAIMYQRTRSIYPGIILHATWNFMVLMIAQAQLTG